MPAQTRFNTPPLLALALAHQVPNSTKSSSSMGDGEVVSVDEDSPERIGSGSSSEASWIQRIGSGIAFDDLRFVKRLGSGDIGSVYLAELRGGLVAAKVMDKKELQGRSKEGRARTEREILEILDHPFLPRLCGSAENERWACLITEFCPGGDLHVLRQRQPARRFDEPAVRFYSAEVVAALEYIHMLGIIYRDLKPENILVRFDGHIMLTDFDLSLKCSDTASTPAHLITHRNPLALAYRHSEATDAFPFAGAVASCVLPPCMIPKCRPKRLLKRRSKNIEFVAEPVDLRSMSFVGTHEYLAPEIVSGEGHGASVDWWTLGVLIYELLYGFTPFKGADNEQTLANIVARALEFPKEPCVSSSAKDLVAGLLAKDPAKRMGCTTGAAAVKRHPFFGGVNWALLRCAAPPYVPLAFSSSSNSNDVPDESGNDDDAIDYY